MAGNLERLTYFGDYSTLQIGNSTAPNQYVFIITGNMEFQNKCSLSCCLLGDSTSAIMFKDRRPYQLKDVISEEEWDQLLNEIAAAEMDAQEKKYG